MGIEAATYLNQLDPAQPGSNDPKSEGDNHIRLMKSVLQTTFPNIEGAMTATHTRLNLLNQPEFADVTAGTAPDYTIATPQVVPTAYVSGQRFLVRFHADGTTGDNTLNINALGAKDLVQYNYLGAKVPALIKSGLVCEVVYDGTDMVVQLVNQDATLAAAIAAIAAVPPPKNHITGLIAQVSGTSFTVSAGECADTALTGIYRLASSMTKSASTAWAKGDGNGALDTGTLPTDDWVAIYLIRETATGDLDLLVSGGYPTPTATPSGWTVLRPIALRWVVTGPNFENVTASEVAGGGERVDRVFRSSDYNSASVNLVDGLTVALRVPPVGAVPVEIGFYATETGGACSYYVGPTLAVAEGASIPCLVTRDTYSPTNSTYFSTCTHTDGSIGISANRVVTTLVISTHAWTWSRAQ